MLETEVSNPNVEIRNFESKRHIRGFWTTELIMEESMRVYQDNGNLTLQLLKSLGPRGLERSISRYYPAGLSGLKVDLGIPVTRKVKGFWNDPREILKQAMSAMAVSGQITHEELAGTGMSSLAHAIGKYYPGKWAQLRIDLGVKVLSRPDGYWTQDKMKGEITNFFKEHGRLTYQMLKDCDRGDLAHAVYRHYPGRLPGLERELGISKRRKQQGYWTNESIEREAKEVYDRHGNLTQRILIKNDRNDLMGAITKYPGKLTGLKRSLGVYKDTTTIQEISTEEADEKMRKILEGII